MRYETIGSKLPGKNSFEETLKHAGYTGINIDRFLGKLFFYGLNLAIIIFALTYFMGFNFYIFTALPLLALLLSLTGPYIFSINLARKRADSVDEILPDALQLMAANIRAGMTTDRAIWFSARPEFGPLQDEIKSVSSKVMGGKSMAKSLNEMTERIDSDLLARAVKLMVEGIESGGEMATLLDQTAGDIRTAMEMRKKVKSNVTMYSMFIIFASVLGAPLLFSISLYFIEVTGELWGEQMINGAVGAAEGMDGGMGGGMGMMDMEGPQVSLEHLRLFAVSTITMTTFFGGLIIGLIQSGRTSKGLKYAPIMIIAALVLFFVSNVVITSIFSGFIGI